MGKGGRRERLKKEEGEKEGKEGKGEEEGKGGRE